MARRKGINERKNAVQISFTPEQLEWLDSMSNYSRAAVVRRCVDIVRRREKISLNALERQADPETSIGIDYATTTDFEIILDAYADLFNEPLKEAASNGHDINLLIPTFMGLIEKKLNKSTSEQQVWRFLYEKMEDFGVTN
ncbi:MAG: hypothetical protein WC262_12455 [Bacteroidales bacterium]|jgi:hypothetical protein